MYKFEFFTELDEVAFATLELPAETSLRDVQASIYQMEHTLTRVKNKNVIAVPTTDSLTIPDGYHGANRLAIIFDVDYIRSLAIRCGKADITEEAIHNLIDSMYESDVMDNINDELENCVTAQLKKLPDEN